MSSKPTIPKMCLHCGVAFLARADHVRAGFGIYCGQPCSRAASSERAQRVPTCAQCGGPVKRRAAIFCSRPCKAAALGSRSTRFWARVDKNGPIPVHRPELGPCWPWIGQRDRHGYGSFVPAKHERIRAPRFAYQDAFGPIPEHTDICHECDNPPCVRPSHLSAQPHAINMADASKRGLLPKGERAPTAKLTEDQVMEIRRLKASGLTQRVIAQEFGVSQGHISYIVNRRSWGHVA